MILTGPGCYTSVLTTSGCCPLAILVAGSSLTLILTQFAAPRSAGHILIKKTGPPNLEELVAAEKEGFLVKARTYVVSLLETMLRDIHFTADIIHGMGCFDPHLLLSLPLDQVTFCFNALFNSFRLRGWVAESAMQDYRDE